MSLRFLCLHSVDSLQVLTHFLLHSFHLFLQNLHPSSGLDTKTRRYCVSPQHYTVNDNDMTFTMYFDILTSPATELASFTTSLTCSRIHSCTAREVLTSSWEILYCGFTSLRTPSREGCLKSNASLLCGVVVASSSVCYKQYHHKCKASLSSTIYTASMTVTTPI